jgi:spermidine synthase
VIPWSRLARAQIPGTGGELLLLERNGEFVIRAEGRELMTSRAHASEEALGALGAEALGARPAPRVLVGGLGMGYTLAAALRALGPGAQVVVAELVPAVVEWNRGPLSALAGHPLRDARVRVREADVAEELRAGRGAWDAVLLDVDNGPEALTRPGNDWLYRPGGLAAARDALRPGGVLATWSAGAAPRYARRLRAAGFRVEERRLPAGPTGRGGRRVVWLATRSEPAEGDRLPS